MRLSKPSKPATPAESSLRNRKQQVVRSALYDAAIELFAAKGFDETTVEEVTTAAGVSRRSFFRYYSSKDDLLAQSVVSYGRELADAVRRCEAGLSPLRVIEETMRAGVEYTSRPGARMREVVTIAAKSRLARQAHASRMMEVDDALAEAFEEYFKGTAPGAVQPRMLSGIALSLMGAVILSWFKREHPDLPTAARHIFHSFSQTLHQTPIKLPTVQAKASVSRPSKASAKAPVRKAAKKRR